MKKTRGSKLILVMLLSLLNVGCNQKTNTLLRHSFEQVPTLEDTRTIKFVEGEADEHGWKPIMEIIIENSKIVALNFDYIDNNSFRKSEDIPYNERMKSIVGIDTKEAIDLLTEKIIDKNNFQVDVISGATKTSNDFNLLLQKALYV